MSFGSNQLRAACLLAVLFVVFAATGSVNGQKAGAGKREANQIPAGAIKTEWGFIHANSESGIWRLTIEKPAPALILPTPMPNIVRATLGNCEWPGVPLEFAFNQDATEIKLHLPADLSEPPVQAILETADESRQFFDGRIVLSALDASVEGATARLESHPGNHRIGFWSNADDFVRWNYKATRPGKYRLYLTCSVAGERDLRASSLEISVGETTLLHTLRSTGSWYDYRSVEIGEIHLAKPVELLVTVKCTDKRGSAVMNLKALTLIPASEGTAPQQSDDGTILLHAADSTLHGTLLQWEPDEKKQTIGYWANVLDSVSWDFTVTDAGKFEVAILQGCGAGQGGSTTEFIFFSENNELPIELLPHTVVDTGHWQEFMPIAIGQLDLTPGKYRLRVKATSKTANAVMDLRQVILRPVRKESPQGK